MSERPNIILIITDQQRADTLGCYGNEVINTPNVDALSREGVTFTDAHCTHPLCMPSRGTLLTGRYPSAHGMWRNGIPLPERENTIAEVLAANNYSTGLFGKAHFTPHNGDPSSHPESVMTGNVAETACWEYWDEFSGPYYGFETTDISLAHSEYGLRGGHYGLWVRENHPDKVDLFSQDASIEPTDHRFPSWKSAVPRDIHSSTWVADRTTDFIRESAGEEEPFFAWVGIPDPHFPFDPPEPYCYEYDLDEVPPPSDPEGGVWGENIPNYIQYYLEDRASWSEISHEKQQEIIAHYYGMVSLIDDSVGKILDAVEGEGLSDDTIVVFTSDHGEWLGDHQLWLKGAIHTRGLTRIPWIVKWPGVTPGGRRVGSVASHLDLVPTLLDAAGVNQPYGVQGTSLREVLSGQTDSVRPYALVEHRHEHYWGNSELSNRYFEQRKSGDVRGNHSILNWGEEDIKIKTYINDGYRLSHVTGTELEYGELFDLNADEEETENLWGIDTELQKELESRLLDCLVEAEDPLPERQYINSLSST